MAPVFVHSFTSARHLGEVQRVSGRVEGTAVVLDLVLRLCQLTSYGICGARVLKSREHGPSLDVRLVGGLMLIAHLASAAAARRSRGLPVLPSTAECGHLPGAPGRHHPKGPLLPIYGFRCQKEYLFWMFGPRTTGPKTGSVWTSLKSSTFVAYCGAFNKSETRQLQTQSLAASFFVYAENSEDKLRKHSGPQKPPRPVSSAD